jgi:hypothetical protein
MLSFCWFWLAYQACLASLAGQACQARQSSLYSIDWQACLTSLAYLALLVSP